MNPVVLLLSPNFGCSRALERALAAARQAGSPLVAVAVIPESQTAALAATLTDVAFVGEKLSSGVVEQIRAEQEALAAGVLRTVRERAQAAGVSVVTEVSPQELREAAEDALTRYLPDTIVIAVPERPWIEKLWGRDHALDWVDDLSCHVHIVEEERS